MHSMILIYGQTFSTRIFLRTATGIMDMLIANEHLPDYQGWRGILSKMSNHFTLTWFFPMMNGYFGNTDIRRRRSREYYKPEKCPLTRAFISSVATCRCYPMSS